MEGLAAGARAIGTWTMDARRGGGVKPRGAGGDGGDVLVCPDHFKWSLVVSGTCRGKGN